MNRPTLNAPLEPFQTPDLIRKLIFLTCGISLVSALTEPILTYIFNLPGLSYLLSLSWEGLTKYFLWQPLSYLFLENTSYLGFSLFFLIALGFDVYLLWVMGSALVNRFGSSSFLQFYLFSGIFSGIMTWIAMAYTGQYYPSFSGPGPVLLATFLAWAMLDPERDLFLYFLFPLKAKWLAAGVLLLTLLGNASQFAWTTLIFYLAAPLFGYFYAVWVWDLSGPFAFTRPIERLIARIKRLGKSSQRRSKIVNFQTGEPVEDDEHFVDEMLAKIGKQGEQSLTWSERRRLNAISQEKLKRK